MPGIDYKAFLNTSLDLELSIGDVIILRSCLEHIISYSTLSGPTRVRIESIDKLLYDSYIDIDCDCLNLEYIDIIKDP